MAKKAKHIFEVIEIKATDKLIAEYASRYLDVRSEIVADISKLDAEPRFKGLGFSTDKLKEVIRENTKPERVGKASRKKGVHRDIYRSDLGELLLTIYFEECLGTSDEKCFIIPIKNIWDRELNDLPGRGFDTLGYKVNSKGIKLLLGESKVSSEDRNPPQVVDASDDSIYKSQLKNHKEKDYLTRRLANFVKKVSSEHVEHLGTVLLCIDESLTDQYEVVYGCCLVREKTYLDEKKDFGKLKANAKEFDPNKVHFALISFDKKVEDVVDMFHKKVEELT